MTRSASARLGVYATFASAAFLAALFMGRPDVAALGAPFAAFLVLALVLARAPKLRVELTLDEERTVEGEPVSARLELTGIGAAHEVELELVLPHGIELANAGARMIVRVPTDGLALPLELVPWRWGAFRLGTVRTRACATASASSPTTGSFRARRRCARTRSPSGCGGS